MELETLRYEVEDGVATLTLDRPEVGNAFNLTMARELRAVWERIQTSADVVCAIVTGAGERAFCTGMDVTDVASGEAYSGGRQLRRDAPWNFLTAVQNRCWKPVVTAVNGTVNGGGLHFVADSDLIVCAEHATFLDTHVKLGLIAGMEPVGLARRIPLEAVLRLSLLGGSERMTAQEAREVGLVREVLPGDAVLPRARELATKIAQHSPTALARTKQAIWESLDVGLDDALERTWEAIQDHAGHPDFQEGSVAFVDRRAPRWKPYTG